MPSYLHSGDLGDIMYALPTMKHIGDGKLYLKTTPHTREPMTPARFEFIRPLLAQQPYLLGVEMHKGQAITHDFTEFREGYVKDGTTLAEMQRRHVIAVGSRPDFSKQWLKTPDLERAPLAAIGRVVVARSARYRNPEWDAVWPTVFRLDPSPVFIGTNDEHSDFQERFGEITHLHCQNAKEMAEIIRASAMFFGNQSFPFSIAEGLKVPRVLEVAPNAADCIFQGGVVSHIRKASEWPEASRSHLVFALQFCPLDFEAALELASIIESLESQRREDCEFAICVRDDVSDEQAARVELTLAKKFRTRVLRSKRSGRGWPDGCNDLWQASMVELGRLARRHEIKGEAVCTFEPDCVPGRRDWIDAITSEWASVKRRGKLCFGHIHEYAHGKLHMNGNLVIDIHATKKFPELQTSSGSWDTAHARLLVENGAHSDLIINRYADNTITPEDIDGLLVSRFAIIHGIKTPMARKHIRELIAQGRL